MDRRTAVADFILRDFEHIEDGRSVDYLDEYMWIFTPGVDDVCEFRTYQRKAVDALTGDQLDEAELLCRMIERERVFTARMVGRKEMSKIEGFIVVDGNFYLRLQKIY